MKKILFSFLCLLLFSLTGCSQKTQNTHPYATGFFFDTVITFTLYDRENDASSKQLLDQCLALARHYEALLDPNMEGSDIWKLNHSDGEPVTVEHDTILLLQTALQYAELSDGAVDPTIGSLSSLWNFGSANQGIVPSSEDIEKALSTIDYHAIQINGNQVTLLNPDAQIELGFIAKGFIADGFRDFLTDSGVSSAIVNLGGNVITIGAKPDGSPFKVGIQKPFANTGVSALAVESADMSVVSSGNYERCFEKDHILYHHILSTETGYPAASGLSQVTILSKQSVDGDALSTLCFILGYEKSVSLLNNYPEIKAVFITEDGQILYHNF